MTASNPRTGHAPVNGLQMYYEIHGDGGVPLVLLHGWFSNIETDFGNLLSRLAESRRVIAVEQQAHGRTADVDRPYAYTQMADDTAALLRHLDIEQADLFGYSMGSAVAIEVARRHPDLVRKLVLTGGVSYALDGLYPEVTAGVMSITPEAMVGMLDGSPFQVAYARLAPNPDDWTQLAAKKLDHDRRFGGWTADEIRAIEAPALLVVGDADIVRPEHVAEMFRLFGGGVVGDFAGLPPSRLAILPGTTHLTLVERADWLVPMVAEFLDAPGPEDG